MSDQTNIDALRDQAARQRQAIAQDLDFVEDRVTPSRIVDRQKAQWRQRANGVRNSVFGDPSTDRDRSFTPTANASESSMTDKAQGAVGDAVHRVADATPDSVGEFTEGNPLAAGLIAFGAGLLAASLIPASPEEQRVADQMQGQLETAASQVVDASKDVADTVRHETEQAAQAVTESAKDSVETVKSDAESSARDVQATAKERIEDVRN